MVGGGFGQTMRRVTLGAGGLSRGLRGIPARHRISCSVSCPLCLQACAIPPTSHNSHCSALPLLHCFTGWSATGLLSHPLTSTGGSNLTSNSPNVGLATAQQPATETPVEQFNIPLNCSGLPTKCEGSGVMSPRYSFILPLQAAQPSHALKKGEIQTAAAEECVKRPRFQSSQTFSVLSPVCYSCNFAGGLSAKREKFTPKNLGVKVLAFRCQIFPFQQFPVPTDYL